MSPAVVESLHILHILLGSASRKEKKFLLGASFVMSMSWYDSQNRCDCVAGNAFAAGVYGLDTVFKLHAAWLVH